MAASLSEKFAVLVAAILADLYVAVLEASDSAVILRHVERPASVVPVDLAEHVAVQQIAASQTDLYFLVEMAIHVLSISVFAHPVAPAVVQSVQAPESSAGEVVVSAYGTEDFGLATVRREAQSLNCNRAPAHHLRSNHTKAEHVVVWERICEAPVYRKILL